MRGAFEHMGQTGNAYRVLIGKPEGNNRLEHIRVDKKIILKWILKDQVGRVWTGFIWLKIRISNGLYSPEMQGMS